MFSDADLELAAASIFYDGFNENNSFYLCQTVGYNLSGQAINNLDEL